MDPNETLRRIRALVAGITDLDDSENPSIVAYAIAGSELARHVDAIDKWISSGGFRPEDWSV